MSLVNITVHYTAFHWFHRKTIEIKIPFLEIKSTWRASKGWQLRIQLQQFHPDYAMGNPGLPSFSQQVTASKNSSLPTSTPSLCLWLLFSTSPTSILPTMLSFSSTPFPSPLPLPPHFHLKHPPFLYLVPDTDRGALTPEICFYSASLYVGYFGS